MANLECSYEDTAYVFMLATTFFFLKKKSFEIITASFNTAHIDWSDIRIIGANRFNIKSS